MPDEAATIPPRDRSAPLRLGLVLGAGGQAGAMFHRGVLRAMEELGLDPRAADVIVGTSAGSLVAAGLRRDAPPRPSPLIRPPRERPGKRPGQRPDPRLGQRSRSGRGAVLELIRRPREGLNALLLRPEFRFGQLDIAEVVDRVRRGHGDAWPKADLWVVAVRRVDGRRVVFGRPGAPPADVASAVAASCAVPGYAAPVEIGGVQYVDGGVYSPTNADLLADCRLDLIVVSSPMSVQLPGGRPRADLPVRLRFRQFLRSEVWALRRRGLRVVTVEPDQATLRAIGVRMLRTSRGAEIERCAAAHAQRRLRGLGPSG